MTRWKKLKKATAGMATMMPMAVATRASPTSDIRVSLSLPCVWFSSWKERMMPMTVPSSPTNGALLPTVPRNARLRSMFRRASCCALTMLSAADSAPRSDQSMPAASTLASNDRDFSRRWRHGAQVALLQQGQYIIAELAEVVARGEVVIGALENDADADHRQADEEPHHPGGAQHREGSQSLLDIHLLSNSWAGKGAAISREKLEDMPNLGKPARRHRSGAWTAPNAQLGVMGPR